ncbi:MAG: DUF58 domain-containing protein [Candidatus Nanohalobium sp.]
MIELDFLEQLKTFHTALKKNSTEIKEGEQKSQRTGQGMIFKDHKQYVPGDDIRKIDWKAYARTNDFYIKRFEEEKNVTVHILLDRSSSMDYGKNNKYEYAAKLAIGAAYMTSKTNDRFRFSVFSETLTDLTAARRHGDLASLVDSLNHLRKTPESRIERCITDYSSRIENKSVVIILSDFLTDTENVETALESLQHTDAVLVNVLDSTELEPEVKGDAILKDPESSSKLRTYLSPRTKEKYRDKLEGHTEKIRESALRNGAEFIQIPTDQDFFSSFTQMWSLINREQR